VSVVEQEVTKEAEETWVVWYSYGDRRRHTNPWRAQVMAQGCARYLREQGATRIQVMKVSRPVKPLRRSRPLMR